MTDPSETCLGVVPRDEQVAALWLLFAAEPEPVRRDRVAATVQAALQGTVDFELLLEARRDGCRVGVVWGQKLAGRNANVWPASLESGESEETADLLQFELDIRLTKVGLAMGQALLPVTATDAAKCLNRNGYRQAANLLYLFSTTPQFPSEAPDGSSLQFETFRESESDRLAHIIEQTYIGSRDAPELDGLRSVNDVIEGYKMTGQFSPERWFFVRREGVDVGCLLLTDHPALRQWELIYMGLIPSARRKGWGSELVRFAQWQARCAKCEVLLVSVDAANEPAVAAYARCGFSELDRREVWVKKLGVAS
jgi:mycothiol synthase